MYNPNKHHRRSIRLRNYNYANTGAYFVTVCLNQRIAEDSVENEISNLPTFGKIENDKMVLNEYGEIASNEWGNLSQRYPNASFNIFQIMPDHIHGIIQIHTPNHDNTTVAGATARVAPTITIETPQPQNQNTTVGATLAVAQNAGTMHKNPNTTNQNANTPTPYTHPHLAGDITKNRATARVAPTITIATPQPQNQNATAGATLAVAQHAGTTHQNPNTTNQIINASTPCTHPHLADDITKNRATARVAPTATIGRIVGAYKSLVSAKCLEISKQKNCVLGKLWQRNYYEHIIRNDTEFASIVNYIYDNPVLWGKSVQLNFNKEEETLKIK
jgi:REP element-mobilizing transposase RayT